MRLKARVTGIKTGKFFNKDEKTRVVIEFYGADISANYIVIPQPEIPLELNAVLTFDLTNEEEGGGQ